jgi:hypothetical protein
MLTEFKLLEEIKGVGAQIMHLSTEIGRATRELSGLNRSASKADISSNRNATSMFWLTFALVFVGIVQILVTAVPMLLTDKDRAERSACFKTVLTTDDIDLNYKNCLRSKGLQE